MLPSSQPTHSAYSIFTETVSDGLVPAWHDECNLPVVFATELEAQREIARDLMEHLQQFLNGERDFDDAIAIGDFILPVEVGPDGRISTEEGVTFGKRS